MLNDLTPKLNFDYLASDTHKTILAKQFMSSLKLKIIRISIYILGAIVLFLLLGNPSGKGILLGFSYLIVALMMIFLMIDVYIYYHHSKSPEVPLKEALNQMTKINLAEYFDTQTVGKLILSAIELKNKYSLEKVDSLLLFLAFSKLSMGRQILLRCGVYFDIESEREIIDQCRNKSQNTTANFFSDELEQIFTAALKAVASDNRNVVDLADIFLTIAENNSVINKLLLDKQLKINDLKDIASWYRRFFYYLEKQYFWQKKYYGRGIGQDWASGYTPVLNYYSKDISEYLLDAKFQIVAESHKDIISTISETLIKSGENNVILVGEKGVGKKTVVNAFAQSVVRGQTMPALRYRHIIELNIPQLLSASSEGELQQRFLRILDEVIHAGNIILFIDGFEDLVNPKIEQLGTIDASQFLIPYLKSNRLQIIATTDYDSWHRKIEANRSVSTLFSKIDVVEPKTTEVMPILEDAIIAIEMKSQVFFTLRALKGIIDMAERYIHEEVFPQKAIELAQSVSAKLAGEKLKIIDLEDVENYVTQRYKVPAKEVSQDEKKKLINLEAELHQKIIDQEEAVTLIANAMRRARAGLARKDKPIGSFLFIGPTGVGKTETAKALAQIYFGSEKDMVRFDMSEFQQIKSLEILIGTSSYGESEQGRLSVAIRENPYTVLLFDEIEKAHPNILNLFLQMLDEGYITDATGRKLNFSNSIIICTSNAGAEEIRQYIRSAKPLNNLSSYILDYLQTQALFRPEFLNRFDSVICFKPLLPEHILAIAKLMIGKLTKKLMVEKEIKLQVSPEAIDKLAQLGYNPELGARPMSRVIQDKLENLLAQRLLKEEIKKGDTVTITEKDIV